MAAEVGFFAARERTELKADKNPSSDGIGFRVWRIGKGKSVKDIMELCNVVRQTAYDIHLYHAHGHLEKVYENALAHRLSKAGVEVKQQHPLTVYDEDGTVIGEYAADLLVDGRLIVELKACRTIADEHIAQILGYLKSARIEHGLLINFGSARFQIKKYILSQTPRYSLANKLSESLSAFFVLFAFFRG
ncbi:MAG: GxxExxY protein [Limisphaerales bacterium]